MKRKKGTKKKIQITSKVGIAHIQSTFNNTIITITDVKGNTIAWTSAGCVGFKGTKKSTPYAAQIAGMNIGKKMKDLGLEEIEVFVKGPGPGREAAIRALQSVGLNVRKVKDVTPIPHNGCRPRKQRRV